MGPYTLGRFRSDGTELCFAAALRNVPLCLRIAMRRDPGEAKGATCRWLPSGRAFGPVRIDIAIELKLRVIVAGAGRRSQQPLVRRRRQRAVAVLGLAYSSSVVSETCLGSSFMA